MSATTSTCVCVLGLGLVGCATAPPADELAVRAVIERTSDALNHAEWKALDRFLTEDAVWEARPPVGVRMEGRAAIHAFLEKNAKAIDVLLISVTSTAVDIIPPDRARARSTMNELIRVRTTGTALQIVGTYFDELVRSDGGWRIERRTFQPRFEADVPVPSRVYIDGSATESATAAFPAGNKGASR